MCVRGVVYSDIVQAWVGRDAWRSIELAEVARRMENDILRFEIAEHDRVGFDDSALTASYCGASVLAATWLSCLEPRVLVIDDERGRDEFSYNTHVPRPEAWWPGSYEVSQDEWPRSITPGYAEFEEASREIEQRLARDPDPPRISQIEEALQKWAEIFREED